MRTLFFEAADTPAEMRDLIVTWLRREAKGAESSSVSARLKRERAASEGIAAAYRSAADFWESVVIEPKTGDKSALHRMRLAAGPTES